jgi:hypothetical protein
MFYGLFKRDLLVNSLRINTHLSAPHASFSVLFLGHAGGKSLGPLFSNPTPMPNSMRKLLAMLAASVMLCLATFTGAHASFHVPDRKVHATEYVMHVPTMDTCVIDTVATTHAAVLQPALGPVAPVSLVAADGGIEYLALIRSMTFPADRPRELVSLLGNMKQESDKPDIDPGRQR